MVHLVHDGSIKIENLTNIEVTIYKLPVHKIPIWAHSCVKLAIFSQYIISTVHAYWLQIIASTMYVQTIGKQKLHSIFYSWYFFPTLSYVQTCVLYNAHINKTWTILFLKTQTKKYWARSLKGEHAISIQKASNLNIMLNPKENNHEVKLPRTCIKPRCHAHALNPVATHMH